MHGIHQVHRGEGGLEAAPEQVEGLHQSIPSRMPGRQRYAEADVEEVPAADRQDGADQHVADQGPAAQRPGGAGEEERAGDRPAERSRWWRW